MSKAGEAEEIAVPEEAVEQRLDRWLKRRYPGVNQGLIQRLLRTGQLRIDGKKVEAGHRLQRGERLRLPPGFGGSEGQGVARKPAPRLSEAERQDLEARILYRDKQLLALNKPAGLAVQGGSGQSRSLDVLAAALVPEGAPAPRLVHRLDRDTTGLLLMALTASAARHLTQSFRERKARKIYWAIVSGVPKKPAGKIDLALSKLGPRGREKMQADREEGDDAETLYALADSNGRRNSLLVLAPLTGRTHQIRAHLASIGHPILGDGKYGTPGSEGLMLHAAEIAVPHPEDETTLRLEAPPPAAFTAALTRLGLKTGKIPEAIEQLMIRGA